MKLALVLLIANFCLLAQASRITIINNCRPVKIWPAILGTPRLSTSGFELGAGQSRTIDVPRPWNGRLWARTNCKNEGGRFVCKTGDCGQSGGAECNGAGGSPPATLVEFNLPGKGGQDFYDISNVDGSNLPVQVTPRGGSGNTCKQISCPNNINDVCPPELQVKEGQWTVGCKSACLAFGKPEYCCSGAHNTPDKCPPSRYSKIFKDKCPQAYSYAYDDHTSTFTCFNNPDYEIKFCP